MERIAIRRASFFTIVAIEPPEGPRRAADGSAATKNNAVDVERDAE